MLLHPVTEWHQPLREKTHIETSCRSIHTHTSKTTHHLPHMHTDPKSSKWLNICIYCCSNYSPVFLFCSFIRGWRQVRVRFNETGPVIFLALNAVFFLITILEGKKGEKQRFWAWGQRNKNTINKSTICIYTANRLNSQHADFVQISKHWIIIPETKCKGDVLFYVIKTL